METISALEARREFIPQLHTFFDSQLGIHWASCDFRVESFHPSLFAHFGIELPSHMEKAVAKRRAEFLAGRVAAARSLAALGCAGCSVPIGENRSPLWPEGIAASISHSDGQALCAASHKSRNDYLGVDLEKLINAEVARDIGSSIVTGAELNLLLQAGLSQNTAITLAFSAKESLFKALYPFIKKYFGFESAQVAAFYPGDSIREGTLTLHLDADLARFCGEKSLYRCDYQWSGNTLRTLVAGSLAQHGEPA